MASLDRDALRQAVSGDARALTELLEEHIPAVRRRIEGRIPPPFQSVLTPDDVIQQTSTDAFLGIESFVERAEGSFQAWLLTIAENNLASALRMLNAAKRGMHRRRVSVRNRDNSLIALGEQLGATSSTPSRHVARAETRRAMISALDQLSPNYRLIVQMCDLEAQSAKEVAQALGRSEGAVYMMRDRAHRRLRQILGGESKYFSQARQAGERRDGSSSGQS